MEEEMMMAPGMDEPGMPAQGGLSQEEMRANLSEMMQKVQGKYGELNSEVFANKNAAESDRQETVRQALQMLQDAGVDVNDPASINEFMMQLQAMNPDLFALFEDALNKLLAGEEEGMVEPGMGEVPQMGQELPPTGPMPEMGGMPPAGGLGEMPF